jgi:SulP family sulfate permease
MDITGLTALNNTLEICKKRGVKLLLSHVNEQPLHVMEKAGFIEKIGKESLLSNIDEALKFAENL